MNTPSFNQEALSLQEKLAGEELDSANCLAVDPAIGCVIGQQFELVERIGEGGMSTVYRARDLQLGREVAIKLLTQTKTRDAASLARFKQEALAVSRLDHPNVVRLYQYGLDDDGRPYLAMDLIEGQSLAQLIEEHHQFSLTDCLSIIDQILAALVHAHGLGIVHRDIKPSNIMVGFDQNKKPIVKVVDFGIAKMASVGDSPALTRTGDMFGSPFYMSPEQCLGNEIDERSDVYSAGCLLYELIEGHPPYQASNTLKVLHMHISERPSQLTRADIDGSCRSALDRIIARSMARDPRARYAGAQLMKDELAQVACGKFKRPTGLFLRGRKGALALICCLLVPAMCGLGMYYYLSQTSKPLPQAASGTGLGLVVGGSGADFSPRNDDSILRVNEVRLHARFRGREMNASSSLRRDATVCDVIQPGMMGQERYNFALVGDDLLWCGLPLRTPNPATRLKFVDLASRKLDGKSIKDVKASDILKVARTFQLSGDRSRALNLYQQVQAGQALGLIDRALLDYRMADIFLDLGFIDYADELYKQALAVLNDSPAHKFETAALQYKLSMCCRVNGDEAGAKALRQRALKILRAIPGKNPKILSTLGDVLSADGQYDQAVAALKQADPMWSQDLPFPVTEHAISSLVLRARLAQSMALAGQVDQGISMLERLIYVFEHPPDNVGPWLNNSAPTAAGEVLPRLYYSLACLYQIKEKNSVHDPELAGRAQSGLTSALRVSQSARNPAFSGLVWGKIAQLQRSLSGASNANADRAQAESDRILSQTWANPSILPTILFDD